MGKIIAWLVLIFIVLLALRLVNQRKARKQQRARAAPRSSRWCAAPAAASSCRVPMRSSVPASTPAPTVNA